MCAFTAAAACSRFSSEAWAFDRVRDSTQAQQQSSMPVCFCAVFTHLAARQACQG